MPIKNISICLNISKPIIYKWINKYNYYFENEIQLTTTTYNEITKKTPHKLAKLHIFENSICNYVNNNKGCTLNEIINNNNITISKSSICRILKNNNITHKKINNKIFPRDYNIINEERSIFANNIDVNYINYIFIDESSFCVNDYARYGYSKKGEIITKNYKHKHLRERKTLLSAINKDNFVSNKIINGSVKHDIYLLFFEENLEIFKYKTILHDNARIHHSKLLKEYCKNNHIYLKYLPPYTPQFNPIELVFSEMKTLFRKLKHTNIIEDINYTINNINTNNFISYVNYSLNCINNYKN
jgi:transposase